MQQVAPLGKPPRELQHTPFGTIAFVQGWCPHCQSFHPQYLKAKHFLKNLQEQGEVRLPRSFKMQAVEATPPPQIGNGVPEMIMIFNHEVVPLKSRFWTDGKQLAMALLALYGPFFQVWKENHRRYAKGKEPLDYQDVVASALREDGDQYSDYNDFILSLPDFLEKRD